MRRPVLYAVLSFLLLVMQGQALVHPFAHLGPARSRVRTGWKPRFRTPCPPAPSARCWHRGRDTVHRDAPAAQLASGTIRGALTAFRSRAAAAPVYFASRAPPVLL